jgi:hypothetical protein
MNARWGWWAAAVEALIVALNVACLIFWDGGPLNWMAVVICTASGIYCFKLWREEVRDEALHRAMLARLDARIARVWGEQR